MFLNLRKFISPRYSKWQFLAKQNENITLLDIGCGNNSIQKTKNLLKNIYYI